MWCGRAEREGDRGSDAGSALRVESLPWGSNHKPQDHDLSQSWHLTDWAGQMPHRFLLW